MICISLHVGAGVKGYILGILRHHYTKIPQNVENLKRNRKKTIRIGSGEDTGQCQRPVPQVGSVASIKLLT